MARIIFGGLVCVTILLVLSPSVLGQKGKGGGGKGGGKNGLDWPFPWPCPMRNTTFQGPLCRPLTKLKAKTYEICGWECNRNRYCQFWTFNEKKERCTLFDGLPVHPWKCYPVEKPNYISGEKGCPIHPYTVQDKSYDATCRPCGLCRCCWGFCFWGLVCIEAEGSCPLGEGPDPSTVLTVEHAQISAGYKASEEGCSTECGEDGSIETCYNCVAGIIKDFPVYCIKCLKSILMEIIVCLEKYDDPKEIIDCVLASPVPDDCTECICDILCHIEPSLCKLCHQESRLSKRSLMRSTAPKCPDSTWQYFAPDKLCYKLFPDDLIALKNQWSAQEACESNGGCLVTIDTFQKQQFINNILRVQSQYPPCTIGKTNEYCVWSSGNTTRPSPPWNPVKTWQWNCPGSPFVPAPFSDTGYINWGPAEPNPIKGETATMFNLFYAVRPANGLWNNQHPSTTMSYMCQVPATT